jgi:hypothetical protein
LKLLQVFDLPDQDLRDFVVDGTVAISREDRRINRR